MGPFWCCPCGDELEEYVNPNSTIYQNYLFLKRFFHRIMGGTGAAFQRVDRQSIMLSFQGGSPSASAESATESEDQSLTDTCHTMTRPPPFDAHQRHSFSQRDGLVSRHDKSLGNKNGSSSGVLHLGSSKKQDSSIVDEESKAKLSDYDQFRPCKQSFRMDSMVSGSEDEELCPTCLEEYTAENPKIVTSCSHHFHLGCIYEWMERSDKCPICGQDMEFCESP